MRNLHVHVYDESAEGLKKADNLTDEVDLVPIDEYEDYIQYGFNLGDRWVEIRVPKK